MSKTFCLEGRDWIQATQLSKQEAEAGSPAVVLEPGSEARLRAPALSPGAVR